MQHVLFIMHLRWLVASTIRVSLFIRIALRSSEPQITLTSWNKPSTLNSPSCESKGFSLKKKTVFCGNCSFITVCSQESSSGPNAQSPIIFKVHFYIIPYTGRSSQWYIPSGFPTRLIYACLLLSCLWYMLHPFRIPWCDIPSNTGIQYTLWSSLLGLDTNIFLLNSVIFARCPYHPVL
jgi:hypothetical protein